MTATVDGIHLGPDTHANRPAATAVESGTLYSCSDHSLIYRSDGTAWATWATLGSTGGGGFASRLLSYIPNTDVMSGVAMTAGNWVDVCPNQNFTVASGGSGIVEVSAAIGMIVTKGSSAGGAAARIVIDSAGTPQNYIIASSPAAHDTIDPIQGGGDVAITGLSVAVHTVKVQAMCSSVAGTGYLRALSFTPSEFLNLQVVQLP